MTTQPLWVTIARVVTIAFAIIGVFSSLGAVDQWNKQNVLYGETAIEETVTVASAEQYSGGFTKSIVSTDGRGYITNSVFSFSRMDTIVVGHTYTIRYFCDPLNNNRRTVMQMIDTATDNYACVTVNGVCS